MNIHKLHCARVFTILRQIYNFQFELKGQIKSQIYVQFSRGASGSAEDRLHVRADIMAVWLRWQHFHGFQKTRSENAF